MDTAQLPAKVFQALTSFLDVIDRRRPNLVDSLYIHGSVAYGDFQPGTSDVNFVAVVNDSSPGVVEDLARSHCDVAAQLDGPFLDGIHLTPTQLSDWALTSAGVPTMYAGTFEPAARFACSPATWLELEATAIPFRGPSPASLGLDLDRDVVVSCAIAAARDYWISMRAKLSTMRRLFDIDPKVMEWCVLHVAWMYHLATTGHPCSKASAGRSALQVFDEAWHPVIQAALAARVDPLSPRLRHNLPGLYQATTSFIDEVISRIPERRP